MQYRILRPLSSCDYIMTFTTNEHNSRATVDYGNGISLSGKCHIVCQARRDNLINIDSRLIIGKHWREGSAQQRGQWREREREGGEVEREMAEYPRKLFESDTNASISVLGFFRSPGSGKCSSLACLRLRLPRRKAQKPSRTRISTNLFIDSLSTRPTDRLRTDFRLN